MDPCTRVCMCIGHLDFACTGPRGTLGPDAALSEHASITIVLRDVRYCASVWCYPACGGELLYSYTKVPHLVQQNTRFFCLEKDCVLCRREMYNSHLLSRCPRRDLQGGLSPGFSAEIH
eukprot:1219072-Rhodomonas_salina.1